MVYIYIYIHIMEYCSAMRRKEILPFAKTWVTLEGIMLTEASQTAKEIYSMISLNIETLERTKSEKQSGGYQELEGGEQGKILLKSYKLPFIRLTSLGS